MGVPPLDALTSLAHRAATQLDRHAGRDGDCWVWRALPHRSGYIPVGVGGVVTTSARAVYFLLHGGRMPDGRLFRTCDTPGCCRHLVERAPVSRPGGVKIPRRTVEAMRRARRRGLTWRAIGARFNVHRVTAARRVQGMK